MMSSAPTNSTVSYYTNLSSKIGMRELAPTIDLQDRVILVTGAASGIGEAFTRAAITRFGAKIIGLDIQKDKLDRMRDEFGPGRFVRIAHDLNGMQDERFQSEVIRICDRFGTETKSGSSIDGYFMNAGIQKYYPWETAKSVSSTDSKEFRILSRINADSHYDLYKILRPFLMNSDAGRVVATSSAVIGRTDPKMMAYIKSKAELVAYTSFIKEDLKDTNVLVNAFIPTSVQTPFRRDYVPDEFLGSNPQAKDVAEGPSRLFSRTAKVNNTMVSYVDKRVDGVDKNGKAYKYNKRTATGYEVDIKVRSPLHLGSGTEGMLLIESYDTGSFRKLIGAGPAPAIDETLPLRNALPKPYCSENKMALR